MIVKGVKVFSLHTQSWRLAGTETLGCWTKMEVSRTGRSNLCREWGIRSGMLISHQDHEKEVHFAKSYYLCSRDMITG